MAMATRENQMAIQTAIVIQEMVAAEVQALVLPMVYRAGIFQVHARFQDQYKYGGKVSVDITVDENGTVTSAHVKPGSPFADLNSIAEKRARQLKFNKGNVPQTRNNYNCFPKSKRIIILLSQVLE